MAVLKDGSLSFEFRFKELDECLWVKYEFFFRWQNESVFRDELLKRSPEGWAGRSEGALLANEDSEDSFLPVLREAVEATGPICWEPVEPDILIAFYPDQKFPLIPGWQQGAYADHVLKEMEERQRRKEAHNGRLPDDIITMIVFVDAYNFRGASPYYGAGFAMIMRPTRAQLAEFCKQLEKEYEEFKVRERLVERLAAREAWWDEGEEEDNEPSSEGVSDTAPS